MAGRKQLPGSCSRHSPRVSKTMTMTNHDNLYLSIGSFFGSVCSFFLAYVTTYHIAWLIGAIAGLVSIWAGRLTIKERQLNIKIANERLKQLKKDNETSN